ncbi:MAG TPA: polysaccharide biosynthesis/export family protein, partial [Candidatus Rifleibacterium sp.]|nr:polysaccharide biosynthesis/export family protein [Candidatus Rifleibacterium sp.]
MNKIKWFIFIILLLGSATGLVNAASPASLRAGDLIGIWVKGEPELSVERQIGQDGSITLPLIGSVGVSGMKTTDAARLIAQMLEDGYLKDPLVQITLKSKASGKLPVAETLTKVTGKSIAGNNGFNSNVSAPAVSQPEQLLVE